MTQPGPRLASPRVPAQSMLFISAALVSCAASVHTLYAWFRNALPSLHLRPTCTASCSLTPTVVRRALISTTRCGDDDNGNCVTAAAGAFTQHPASIRLALAGRAPLSCFFNLPRVTTTRERLVRRQLAIVTTAPASRKTEHDNNALLHAALFHVVVVAVQSQTAAIP